jgi:two-component system chemotaxis response regulator CheY
MEALKTTVLIVDDDSLVRTLLADALQATGWGLLQAQDGDEALEQVKQHRPGVVLMDLFMPRRSGLDALAAIRAAHPSVKVFVISSLDSGPLVEQALRLGATGFIAKPFHPVEIAEQVRRALAS